MMRCIDQVPQTSDSDKVKVLLHCGYFLCRRGIHISSDKDESPVDGDDDNRAAATDCCAASLTFSLPVRLQIWSMES